MTHLILSPTLVQGIDAPPQIVRAIERLNTYGQVDVILLIRGGGSLEDLWCFNDERVARAVAASTIPVITGVGHEIDFTLVDFVSDLRAPTPSAAAEQATPHIDGVREALRQRALALTAFTQSAITTRQDDLRDVLRTFAYVSPEAHIRTMRQQIDTYAQRAERAHNTRHTLLGERLRAKVAALEAANPQALLKRGYALVRRADGSSVSQVSAVNNGDRIVVHVSDGTFDAEVKK